MGPDYGDEEDSGAVAVGAAELLGVSDVTDPAPPLEGELGESGCSSLPEHPASKAITSNAPHAIHVALALMPLPPPGSPLRHIP